jgi:hypothetical protein
MFPVQVWQKVLEILMRLLRVMPWRVLQEFKLPPLLLTMY